MNRSDDVERLTILSFSLRMEFLTRLQTYYVTNRITECVSFPGLLTITLCKIETKDNHVFGYSFTVNKKDQLRHKKITLSRLSKRN